MLGIFVRLAYASYNDAIFTHQYDVWSTSYTGHYGITMHIYETFSPPDLIIRNGVPSLDNSYQFYQPKFVHYVFASLMHVNKYLIGTENTFTLYQSLRIYTCVVSLSIMVIGYYILKELFNNKKSVGFMVGVLFIVAAPFLIRVTSMTNNDGFLWLFVFLSVYTSIRWYKNVSLKYSILLAISIGLAMSSKLSGAVIAIPIGLMMLFKLVVLIRQKEFKKILLNYLVFALLVFPIGLFWPLYNYYTQDQPFTYVWSNLNTNLLLDEGVTFYDRFIAFPIGQYFKYIFMMLWPSSIPKDYNIYTSIMKSSIFGEFTDYVGIGLVFGGTLWVVNFILMMMLVLGSAYLVIRAITKKKYVSAFYLTSTLVIFYTSLLYFYNNETLMLVIFLNLIWIVSGIVIGIKYKWFNEGSFAPIFMLLIFITMMISYVGFNVANPYTCTLDFRYIALIYIPLGFLLIKLIDTLREEKSKVFKVISYVVIVTASIYSLSSICFYTTIG